MNIVHLANFSYHTRFFTSILSREETAGGCNLRGMLWMEALEKPLAAFSAGNISQPLICDGGDTLCTLWRENTGEYNETLAALEENLRVGRYYICSTRSDTTKIPIFGLFSISISILIL